MRGRTTTIAVVFSALLVGAAVGAAAGGLFAGDGTASVPSGDDHTQTESTDWTERTDAATLETFESAAAFEEYFERNGPSTHVRFQTGGPDAAVEEEVAEDAGDASGDGASVTTSALAGDDVRSSETNVQVAALDEPDALKNDGETAYYANHRFHARSGETAVLDLSDPADPEAVATIPATGQLLLADDVLVVLDHDRAYGYDVSDPSDPDQVWAEDLEARLETARLHEDGSLYLVLVDHPSDDPCPIEPYGDAAIECTDVRRPAADADGDAVYTAARVNPETGAVEDSTSVVGTARHSATYVSEGAIYLSYTWSASDYEVLSGYLLGPGSDHLDATSRERLEALDDYDISERAKEVEMRQILDDWRAGLDEDERREVEREFEEGLKAYASEHQRDLSRTGVVRVSIDGALEPTASGEVPGVPLNQFSMDEHEDHLRIATTIPRTHGADSVNDVYVLDSNLEVTGEVQGLGEDERIYSVRFEGDEGHVVTFREIDPFYTLDLSDPTDPRVEGELKLPGVSEYLHPLEEDLILGIGQEDRKVKATTFDVSDRENPVELESVILEDEHFSEIARNHRAFLQDGRHEVFFLPGTENSYVFGYADGDLEEVARVDVGGPGVRAMYVGDYLYVVGEEQVVVLDETTWEEETRVDL
ncbi:beta-propeller domain-containing protein [Salinilacihabitans rarus]|uniref:beta-propeller domain-containing protein n=1 Tax=Salinilacihabitans rarus TaxID=2961596 RepID=UPI0020C86951|nr:beta-propeller domain-containing protein [Salinilacihabitans rarus]